MDWHTIGQWAGDKGPYLAIIAGQWGVIWRLLAIFFRQQQILTDQMQVNAKAVDAVERVAK